MGLAASKNVYDEHFGFSDLPFSISPNPRFVYDNPFYREAFATLCYGIEARKGFIVVTGEVGTGKTTLLRAVMHNLESTVHTAFIFNPKLTFSQLLRSIFNDLGITESSQDRLTLITKLNNYLLEQLKKDHVVAILIDEAQDLSDDLLEEIRLLSNLETDSGRLIQIVLMGQPELEQRLEQPHLRQLKQRIALRCRLTPLPKSEVGSYINYRLKKAGYQGKEIFEAKAIEKISLNSQGIPRIVNVICDNALLIAYASSKKKVSAEIVEEVARDLQLTAPGTDRVANSETEYQGRRGRDERWNEIPHDDPETQETRRARFGDFSIEERPRKLNPKRRPKGLRIATLLVLLTISIGAALYAQQNPEVVTDIVMKAEDYSTQGKIYASQLAETMDPHFQRTRDSVFDATANIGSYFQQSRNYLVERMQDHFPQTKDYLSGLAVKTESFIIAQWENLKAVNLIPTSEDRRTSQPESDFLENHSAPAADEMGLLDERLNPLELNENAAQIPDAKTIPEGQPPKTPPTPMKEETRPVEPPEKQSIEPRAAAPEKDPAQISREIAPKREQPAFLGNFEVVQESFLRDKPESNSAVTILPPGTRVRVEGKEGDYLRVRSLSDPGLRGYMHREDAFFERVR
jgi:general secretion pathway protein A